MNLYFFFQTNLIFNLLAPGTNRRLLCGELSALEHKVAPAQPRQLVIGKKDWTSIMNGLYCRESKSKNNFDPEREKVSEHLCSILCEPMSKSNNRRFVLDSTQYIVSNRPNLQHIDLMANQCEEEV